MAQGKEEEWERRALELVGRHWKLDHRSRLAGLLRLVHRRQMAARSAGSGSAIPTTICGSCRSARWLHGQGWYDLRNYRLNPPFGANIHWSRLVDLPIAGLILGLRPFLGGAAAERWAVAIAPMLPYLLLLFSLALTARRLLGPTAYPLAFLALFFAGVDQRHVHAGADRSPWLAARAAGAQHRRRSPIPSACAAD